MLKIQGDYKEKRDEEHAEVAKLARPAEEKEERDIDDSRNLRVAFKPEGKMAPAAPRCPE
jgi:hypothetical protein